MDDEAGGAEVSTRMPTGRATSARAAVIAGSVAALILASLLGGALGSIAKAACRAGAWNVGVEQYQAHCYTDIYPLYFDEGLSAGRSLLQPSRPVPALRGCRS